MPPSRPRSRERRPRYSLTLRLVAPFVVIGWLIATGAALKYIPPLTPTGSRSVLGSSVGANSPVVKAAILDAKRFDFPVASEVVIVQHKKGGLSAAALTQTAHATLLLDEHKLPGLRQIGGGLPIASTGRLLSLHPVHATTVLTFLLFKPDISYIRCTLLAERYAARYLNHHGDGLVGVTGAYPAEYHQGLAISGSLSLVQWLAIGILIAVVGLTFRSLVAPLLTLLSAGIAYELSQRLLSLATIHLGVSVPSELDPIIVVLLLGLMTDYSVFYLTAFRRKLDDGAPRKVAAPLAFREITPIVAVAGFTVAIGVALIELAHLPLFSALGPGLAITVAVTVVVAMTFIPAALALLGKYALWPHTQAVAIGEARQRFQRLVTHPWIGGVLAVLAVGGLVWLSLPLGSFSLGIDLIGDLPAHSQSVRAAEVAGRAMSPGVIAPTEVLVTGAGSTNLGALAHLQTLIQHEPGVSGVVGPGDDVAGVPLGVFVSATGQAARYLVVFRHDPFSSYAIADYNRLEQAMPRLLARSGLRGATTHYTGDTALAADIAHTAIHDLVEVAVAVILVDFLLLALYLRAIVAPLVLVAASALVVASALGITMLVFPATAGANGYTFYAPFATEVLLLSFGTDYNLFLTGEIWNAARRRRFRRAVAHGGSVASAGINVAGATLGLSFAVLLVVPLRSFGELAVAIFGGLVIDSFIVRFFVVPGVLSLLGTRAGWPGHRLQAGEEADVPTELTPLAGWQEDSDSRTA